MPLQLRDSGSYETQIIDAVRSVNKALGGTYGTSSSIYKTDFNQYEVQLIDAIKGIGRTLSGKGLSVYGGASGGDFVTKDDFDTLVRRVVKLEDESFFKLDSSGNVTLKDNYSNLWVPGWLAAGGIGSGSGGGSNVSVTQILTSGTAIATITVDGTDTTLYAPNGGGGSGTVTSVKVGNTAYNPDANGAVSLPAYPSALSQLSTDSTHRVVTDTQISTWNAKQDSISDLATIRAGAALGATAVQTETDPTVPNWAKQQTPSLYVGKTRVKTTNTSNDTLIGIDGFTTAASTTASGDTSKVVWDSTNGAWHFLGNLYADGWVAAGGVGSGGSGGGADLPRVWDSLTNAIPDAYTYTKINASHLPDSLKNPYALTFGSQTYDGSSAKTITASDLGALTQSAGDGRYLRLSGGTMTGDIVLNGADIEPSTDDTCYLGGSTRRFNNGFIRNIYTSFLEFVDGSTRATRGNFSIGDGYASIIISGSPSNTNYMFYDGAGFFHGGDGVVPCGRSDHRWSKVYSNEVDIKGGLVFRNSSGNKTGYISAQDGYLFFQAGTNIESSYKQLTFNPSLGLYPESSGLALGYNGANYRWSTIYGVNADLTGDLTLASTSHIDLGPLRLEYDTNSNALHVTKASSSDSVNYGFYADGFVAAGGIGTGGSYITFVRCSQSQYDAITNKSETTMYYIGDPTSKIYLGSVLIYTEN